MGRSITFNVPGAPRGKGRPRFSTRNGYAKAYTDSKTVTYEGMIRLFFTEAAQKAEFEPIRGPVLLSILAVMPIPTSWSKKKQAAADGAWNTTKPDKDNIEKAVSDALNKVAYTDDKLIASSVCNKIYGSNPRLIVTLEELEGIG